MAIGTLLERQNPDGGWPYVRGGSWVEPTVYAVLALLSAGEIEAARRGVRWVRTLRRPDGGWAPRAEVVESTWVTALVALLPPEFLGETLHRSAIAWLVDSQGRETTLLYRVREWLLGNPSSPDQQYPGWPWIPGAAAWVGPTSISILALQKNQEHRRLAAATDRISRGQTFLLRHMCEGGGWNHGGIFSFGGYPSHAYPETTGMALAALRGAQSPKIDLSIQTAHRFLRACRSADALNWLRIGLRAHGQLPSEYCPPSDIAYRTIPEASLDVVLASSGRGQAVFGA